MEAIRAINLPFLPEPSRPAALAPVAAASLGAFQADRLELGFGTELPPPPPPATGTTFLSWLRQRATQFVQGMSNPLSFFITQYRSAFNTQEDTPGNGNCGPTCLTMVAMAFGRTQVAASGADAAIERTRAAMTGRSSEMSGTSIGQLGRGATSYGLASRQVSGNLATLQAELNQGRLPICLISPREFRNSTSRGHYVVVTKIDSQGVHCNDPAIRTGPIVIPAADFMRGWQARGALALSVGA